MAKTASAILSNPRFQMQRQTRRNGGRSFGSLGPINPAAKPMQGQTSPFTPPAAGAVSPYAAGKSMTGVTSPFSGGGMGGGMTLAAPLQTGPATGGTTTTTAAATASPSPTGYLGPGVIETPAMGGGSQSALGPTDPWGYPTQPPYGPKIGRKGKKKFGGHGYAQRAYRKLPPWLQDPTIFNEMTGGIAEILGQKGHLSPELLQRQQAGIESGRQQSQQALLARLAQAGVDPSSPEALSMAGTADQAANRLQHQARADEDIRAAQQWRQDLGTLPIPLLQAILGFTTKRGGGGVTAAPQGGGGGGGPDYLGAASNIAGSILGGWAQGGFRT